ncbi:IMP dehydrogenase [Caldilinea sp.]|uniref:IMP dehydrogenase n=1 Tax=Caldilinea sp. TaxID=2293560 RepID=UPI002CF07AFE|nr:IMP dehydrogenase [Anaerolineales bacterium]HQY92234.1 IMP dehydrogenase [Caldilinea sp.]
MRIRTTKGLTFDDVLLAPRQSPIRSRSEVDVSSRLTRTMRLAIPILSANMDTVTEWRMAAAIARAGGLGVLHRFMSVEQQVKQVAKVKRAQGLMVENPYTVLAGATVAEAEQLMTQHEVGGLIVVDDNKKLVGLITRRDILLAPEEIQSVAQAMTPADHIVSVGPSVTSAEARALLYQHRLEKLPVVDRAGKVVGLITSRDVVRVEHRSAASVDARGRLLVGAAIGVGQGEIKRAEALLEAGADLLVLDIAHGHANHCIEMVQTLRRSFPAAQLVAGNIATAEGARDLAEAGADAIKVGIGPGSICTTRIVTGFGVPQLTAIMEAVRGLSEAGLDAPVIADGGVKTSGDLVKALAAGASTVMIGSLFAGCEEAPGAPVIRNGQKVKVIRGMASLGAAMGRRAAEQNLDESAEDQEDWDKVVPEGVEAVVPYRGEVAEILHQLVGGLRSGLSYGGARDIEELQRHAEFIEITSAGVRESGSHDVRKI